MGTHCLSRHPLPLSLNAVLRASHPHPRRGAWGAGGETAAPPTPAGSGSNPALGRLGAVLYICTNSGEEKPHPRLTDGETEAGRQSNGRPRSQASQVTSLPGREYPISRGIKMHSTVPTMTRTHLHGAELCCDPRWSSRCPTPRSPDPPGCGPQAVQTRSGDKVHGARAGPEEGSAVGLVVWGTPGAGARRGLENPPAREPPGPPPSPWGQEDVGGGPGRARQPGV